MEYKHKTHRTTAQIIGFATFLSGVYVICLFVVFYSKIQSSYEAEFQRILPIIQHKTKQLQEVADHLAWCLTQAPDMSEMCLREILSEMRLSAPLNFPILSSFTWIPKNGRPIRIAQDQKLLEQDFPAFPRPKNAQAVWNKAGPLLSFQQWVGARNARGCLVVATSLASLCDSLKFFIQEVMQAPPLF